MNKQMVKTRFFDHIFCILLAIFPIIPSNYPFLGSVGLYQFFAIVILMCSLYYVNRFNFSVFKENKMFWLYFVYIAFHLFFTTNNILFFAIRVIITLAVPFVTVSIVKEQKMFNLLLKYVMLFGVIMAIIGIYESFSGVYVFQQELLGDIDNMRYGILRCSVTFGNPIIFGIYEVFIIVLLFYRLMNSKKNNRKKLYLPIVICGASIFCSVSRLAFIMLFVFLIIMAYKRGIKGFVKYAVTFACLLIILISASELFQFEFLSFFQDIIKSIESLLGISNIKENDYVGYGNRLDLYEWVYDDVKNNLLFGMGERTEFFHQLNEWTVKNSIEVHYLYTLFHYGLIAVILLVIKYISNMFYLNKTKSYKLPQERNISFNKICLYISFIYYICLFGVQEVDLSRFITLIVCLSICYSLILKKSFRKNTSNVSYRGE